MNKYDFHYKLNKDSFHYNAVNKLIFYSKKKVVWHQIIILANCTSIFCPYARQNLGPLQRQTKFHALDLLSRVTNYKLEESHSNLQATLKNTSHTAYLLDWQADVIIHSRNTDPNRQVNWKGISVLDSLVLNTKTFSIPLLLIHASGILFVLKIDKLTGD